MAPAHTIGSKVEAAHRRGDLFDKRRSLMTDGAKSCALAKRDAGRVVPISRRG